MGKKIFYRNVGHIAAAWGNLGVIRFLKDGVGFDFSKGDFEGVTAYEEAVEAGDEEMIGLLKPPE